jgi:hypothetical protein
VSLASLGSGYYTTGRANPDCKTNNLGIPWFLSIVDN